MDDLDNYNLVNKCETFKELADAIRSFANDDGSVDGKTRPFNAENMALHCENFLNTNPNILTRRFGIRQQALYIKHYLKYINVSVKRYDDLLGGKNQ